MPAVEEVFYRLRLVLGFLEEARQDFNLGRWRSCVDNQSDKRESMNLQKIPELLFGALILAAVYLGSPNR